MRRMLALLISLILIAPALAAGDGQITVYGAPDGTYATITADDDVRIEAPGAEVAYLPPEVFCSLETPHFACANRAGQPFAVQLRLSAATDRIVVTRGLGQELARWDRDAAPPTPPPVVYEPRRILIPVWGP